MAAPKGSSSKACKGNIDNEWPPIYDECLLGLLKQECKQGNTDFGVSDGFYERVTANMITATGASLTPNKVRAAFLRLRNRFRYFNFMLEQPGFGWNPATNRVSNQIPNWKAFTKMYPFAKDYERNGESKYYELWMIFFNNFDCEDPPKNIILDDSASEGSCPPLKGKGKANKMERPVEQKLADEYVVHSLQESVNQARMNRRAMPVKPQLRCTPQSGTERIRKHDNDDDGGQNQQSSSASESWNSSSWNSGSFTL